MGTDLYSFSNTDDVFLFAMVLTDLVLVRVERHRLVLLLLLFIQLEQNLGIRLIYTVDVLILRDLGDILTTSDHIVTFGNIS